MIGKYEEEFDVTLIVMIDAIFAPNMTFLEELLFGIDVMKPLHLLLASPGGDGEAAIRMVRSIQACCCELTIIVPDLAKSAATLMCLGADQILMGPGGDLGPVDPQFQIKRGLVGAKEIVSAVDEAERRITNAPETFPLFATLLADVNMPMVQQARSALQRSEGLVREALGCASNRSEQEIDTLTAGLKRPLIDEPVSHSAVISADFAAKLGLPAKAVDIDSPQWQYIWNLWTRYYALGCFPAGEVAVYEGKRASHINDPTS